MLLQDANPTPSFGGFGLSSLRSDLIEPFVFFLLLGSRQLGVSDGPEFVFVDQEHGTR